MTPGQTRLYWRATEALREAETLADMPTPGVSGPADEPPRQDSDVSSWLDDWGARAKRTLEKAEHWATSPERWLRERAQRAVVRIREGSRAIRRAAGRAADKVLKPVVSATNALQWGVIGFDAVATIAIGYIAYRLFFAKKG